MTLSELFLIFALKFLVSGDNVYPFATGAETTWKKVGDQLLPIDPPTTKGLWRVTGDQLLPNADGKLDLLWVVKGDQLIPRVP